MAVEFWLVTTEHLKERLWFKDEEDFKVGMNFVAIVALLTSVHVIAFSLMSNHVHFVLECSRDQAESFISRLKIKYSQYYSRKYGSRELLRNNSVDIRRLLFGDESLERAIAYVQMNCVAANICLHPSSYPWGTGELFFRVANAKGVKVSDLSGRKREHLIHCRTEVPSNWIVDDRGYINPSSYVNEKLVESLFRTPKRMDYFLKNSSKARKAGAMPTFDDQLIGSAIQSLCTSLFRKKSFTELEDGEQSELFKQLRYRFSADPNQISRISGVPYEDVARLLDAF